MPDTNTPTPSGGAAPAAPSSTPSAQPAPATAAPAASSAGQPSSSPSPAAVQPVPGAPASTGEPPKERWNDILDNARKKTRAEVEQEYRQRYGHYDQFEKDPWSAIQGWLQEASQHSLYKSHVQEWAKQYLGSQAGPRQQGEEPKADVPIVDASGQVTGYTYSDKRLKEWHQWNQAQQQQALDERFRPIEEANRQTREREELAQTYQEAMGQANQTLGALRQLPYFTAHEADIRQALEEHEEWGDNVHAAYNHVLITKILPTLGQAEQQKVIDSLQNKASGATVAPNGAVPNRPAFRSFREAAEYFAAHPDEAARMANRE